MSTKKRTLHQKALSYRTGKQQGCQDKFDNSYWKASADRPLKFPCVGCQHRPENPASTQPKGECQNCGWCHSEVTPDTPLVKAIVQGEDNFQVSAELEQDLYGGFPCRFCENYSDEHRNYLGRCAFCVYATEFYISELRKLQAQSLEPWEKERLRIAAGIVGALVSRDDADAIAMLDVIIELAFKTTDRLYDASSNPTFGRQFKAPE